MLIACNHPNSFLDAIILATLFRHPVYSLARGDVFANNFLKRVLHSLNMLPVYRISEGVENLEHNYTTFAACTDIFKKKGIVLMFSEGLCKNEWHLRPLKKGTARLAVSAWQQGIPLKVLPVGINYSAFRLFGKNVIINFGEIITEKNFDNNLSPGNILSAFNNQLDNQLKQLVLEIEPTEIKRIKKIFYIPQPVIKKIFLFIPAIFGWLLHVPLYYPIILKIKNKARDHYDSIVVGLLFILYPVYLLAITFLVYFITANFWFFLLLILIPFTGWSYLQLKRQV